MLLAVSLIYVSFSASSEAKSPADLRGAAQGETYEVFGVVSEGSVSHEGEELHFDIEDREDPSETIAVSYVGTVPDPFREGREVIITGELRDGVLVGERDSLITKCPSKFAAEAEENPDQIIIED